MCVLKLCLVANLNFQTLHFHTEQKNKKGRGGSGSVIRANREDFRRDSWGPPLDVGGRQSAPHHLHNHLIIKTPNPHRHRNTNTQNTST